MVNNIKLNYTIEEIVKEINPILKQFKNRRQLSKKFIMRDAFPMDKFSNDLLSK